MRAARAPASPGADDQPAIEGPEGLREPPDLGRDHRRAGREPLEHDEAEALQRERRQHAHVGGVVAGEERRLVEAAEEAHEVPDAELLAPAAQGGRLRPVAHHQEQGRVGRRGQPGPRVEQDVQAHPRHQAPHRDGDEGLGGKAEPRARGVAVAGAEGVEIDARRNHLDLPGRDAVPLDEQPPEGARQHHQAPRAAVDGPLDEPLGRQPGPAPLARGGALLGPGAVEVDDQGQAPQPRVEQRERGVEGEVGVEHGAPAGLAPRRPRVAPQAARQRVAVVAGHGHAARRVRRGAHDHPAGPDPGVGERPQQVADVPVEAAGLIGRPSGPEQERRRH